MKQDMDRLMKKAGRAANTAMKATAQLVEKGRDQVDKLALQTRIGKLEKQLGALVYTMKKGNAAADDTMVDWYVGEIDRLKKQLAAFEQPPKDNVAVHTPFDAGEEAADGALLVAAGCNNYPRKKATIWVGRPKIPRF